VKDGGLCVSMKSAYGSPWKSIGLAGFFLVVLNTKKLKNPCHAQSDSVMSAAKGEGFSWGSGGALA
jgi:hypothetical protein